MVVSVGGFAVGVVGQSIIVVSIWAALFAILAGVSSALFLAAVLVLLFAADYARDRVDAASRLRVVWPYVVRTTTWGFAAAGIGALLATALPARIADAFSDPHAIPISGWMAITFGGVGAAAGILEEWRLGFRSAERESGGD
jgi:hypothetical protein